MERQPEALTRLQSPPESLPIGFHELLVEDWLTALHRATQAGERSEATHRAYRSWIRPWLASLAQETAPPSAETVRRFVAAFRCGRQPATVNGTLQAIRSCYAWAETQDRYEAIGRSIPLLKIPTDGPMPIMSPGIIAAAAIAAGTPHPHRRRLSPYEQDLDRLRRYRDEALIRCLYATGARVISMVRANVGDYRRMDDPPTLSHQPKGHLDNDARAVLPPHAAGALERYLSERQRLIGTLQGPLWIGLKPVLGSRLAASTIHRVVVDALKRTDAALPSPEGSMRLPRGCSPHGLRRSAITQVVAAEGLESGQVLAGHVSSNTTRLFYARVQRQAILDQVSQSMDIRSPFPSGPSGDAP